MHMKNKLFYLFGAAFLLCSIGTFTACSDGDDDPIVEVPGGDDDENGGDDNDDTWVLSGEYFAGNAKALKMTYNGEELTGRKVALTVDNENKKASMVLEGVEKDLGAMLSGIIDLKLKPSSPIPGEERITLSDIALTPNSDATEYTFKGEDRTATRVMTYKGAIKKGEMSIEITNKLSKEELAGTWTLPVKITWWDTSCQNSAPLWVDWDTNIIIDPGTIPNGDNPPISGLDQSPNKIFTTLLILAADPEMSSMYGFNIAVEQWIANMLNSITAQPNGCMYAKYSYSGDVENPLWSEEMSHNLIRYYYGENSNEVYIEANIDFILNSLLGALTRTRAEGDINEIIAPLIEILKPALEKGFPCTYEINGDEMMINLNGTFTLEVLKRLVTLLNDPTINGLIMSLLENDATLAPYVPNVNQLLKTLPDALTYNDYDETTNEPTGECTYVKVGLQLKKAAK